MAEKAGFLLGLNSIGMGRHGISGQNLIATAISPRCGGHPDVHRHNPLQSVKPNLAFVFHGDATSLGVTPK